MYVEYIIQLNFNFNLFKPIRSMKLNYMVFYNIKKNIKNYMQYNI